LLLAIVFYFLEVKDFHVDSNRHIIWGVTFSPEFSQTLNVDWQKTFEAILDDLRPNKIRIAAYWDNIEKTKGQFDFFELDWQMNELQKRGVKTVLAIGMKVPRWPECHIPDWVAQLSVDEREKALQEYMTEVVKRYKNYQIIDTWQVENEPFLAFGACPARGDNFLSNEVSLVKTLDSTRPILTIDSGELGSWYKSVKSGDIFGTTMYRRVYNRIFGQINYHLPPNFFILKEKIVRFLLGDYNKKFIVAELAVEPWLKQPFYELSIAQQLKAFDLAYFKDTIQYAKAAGFDEYYLWGVEWWYYLKMNGHTEIWNEAKKLFSE